ncbi:aa3-type cytochrome c oxidase subunit IV [Novosphingobium sp. AP12]|jgi:hypothetical protein|nr:aa3-type cytochrome c oxidase subunit IV [Novosphingobium sp. AP12]EJL32389.1 Bacterial aa3 type cytochrome c oxidase subunit IV [Novosphingobium sp. AP12]
MASGNDIKAATATYNSFIKMATWGTIACVVIAAGVVGLIAS